MGYKRRLSNSTDTLDKTSEKLDNDESIDQLNAEPYLQPMEVQMVMHTLPRTQRVPESDGFHSIREVKPSNRPALPMAVSTIEVSDASMRESPRRYGHRRTASNPWILERGREGSLTLPPLPPPVPKRDYKLHRNSASPQPNQSLPDPTESSLDFNRRSVTSPSPIPNRSQSQSHYADIDDVDNLSTISGPFEEISDDPDASNTTADMSNQDRRSDKSATMSVSSSQAHLVKKKSSTMNSDYEKIEDYVSMAPVAQFARHSMPNPDTPNPTISSEHTPKKSASKTSISPPKAKKPKSRSRQPADSVIPDAATIRSSSPPLFPTRRFTMLDSYNGSQRASYISTNTRPLPPSPTKSLTSLTKTSKGLVRKKSSSGSNIYESIDEEMLNRVNSRSRRGSGLPRWAPPVRPENHEQYMVILQKFFTAPEVVEMWEKTVKDIIPGGDLVKYPPPYSNLPARQTKKLGATVVLPKSEEVSSPKVVHQMISHTRESSHDQYVIPVLNPQISRSQASSTPVTPAPNRVPQNEGAMSSPRVRFAPKRPASREDLIEMLNMESFNQGDSSDSESSESDHSEILERDEVEDEEEEEGEGSEGEEKEEEDVGSGEDETRRVSDEEQKTAVEGFGRGVAGGEREKEKSVLDDEVTQRNAVGTSSISPETSQSPDHIMDDIDSILTSLNPILSAFTEPDSNPNDTNSASPPNPSSPVPKEPDLALRSSVSTDSDLDSLVKPSALFQKRIPPSGNKRVMKWVNAYDREVENPKEKRTATLVSKRAPSRRREATTDERNLSDSGISNCHSQTYDDAFNPIDTN